MIKGPILEKEKRERFQIRLYEELKSRRQQRLVGIAFRLHRPSLRSELQMSAIDSELSGHTSKSQQARIFYPEMWRSRLRHVHLSLHNSRTIGQLWQSPSRAKAHLQRLSLPRHRQSIILTERYLPFGLQQSTNLFVPYARRQKQSGFEGLSSFR
jgi:hypothetical protein